MKPAISNSLAAAVTAMTAILAATACSSGTKNSTPPTVSAASAPPSAARFAAAADQVCAAQDSKESALGPGLVNADIVPAAKLPKAAAYLDQVVTIHTQSLQQLQSLIQTDAGSDSAAAEAFVHALSAVNDDYRAAASAAHAGNLTDFRAAFDRVAPNGNPTGPDIQAAANALSALPFKQCGKGQNL